jgi:hypothetical protein
MMEAWTLETAATPFSPSLRLEMMQMRLFHNGKWTVLAFFAPGNCMSDVFSSWKMDILL